jgi:hypothetical protein
MQVSIFKIKSQYLEICTPIFGAALVPKRGGAA